MVATAYILLVLHGAQEKRETKPMKFLVIALAIATVSWGMSVDLVSPDVKSNS